MINLLITFDVHGWAYHNRALALAKNCPADFRVTIQQVTSPLAADDIDICFNLDSAYTAKIGDFPHVMSWNADPHRRMNRLPHAYHACDYLIMNNKQAFDAFGRRERTCCIANGVDVDVFRVLDPIHCRPDRVFWTGSSNPLKRKGFEIIDRAAHTMYELGFDLAAFPVDSAMTKPFDVNGMVDQYNASGYVLCMSESDATPNTSLEGMACGCCLVTTMVGNAMEFPKSSSACVFAERTVDGLIDGLLHARDNRTAIATAGMRLMHDRWSYGPPGNRASVYFDLFRRIVSGEPVQPFSYDELHT